MYIKVYISELEMSRRIHYIKFYYNDFLRKWQKNHFLVKKFLDSLQNTILS